MIGTTTEAIIALETMNTADAMEIAARELYELYRLFNDDAPSWYSVNRHLSLATTIELLETHIRMERDLTFWTVAAAWDARPTYLVSQPEDRT